jgi:putative ABC transport system ATP-binding protein
MKPILSCENLSCRRDQWNEAGPARIASISAGFEPGTFSGFCGPDGCGKGLLLNVLGLLEPHDSGTITVDGRDLAALGHEEARQLRNENFGFLFNHPCLLPSFSVAENVAMPLFRICGGDAQAARLRTLEVLDFCGMADLECTLTGRLNLAMQRRAALARALVHSPRILIAISPRESQDLLDIAWRAAADFGICVLWAGEEKEITGRANRILHLREGSIVSDSSP